MAEVQISKMSIELSKPLVFLCALYDFQLSSSVSTLIWDAIKNSYEEITGSSFDENGKHHSFQGITNFEKLLFTDCLETFYIRVRHIESVWFVENKANPEINPWAGFLERECRIFIGSFNSYICKLEGRFVHKYGFVNSADLKIESIFTFSDILKQVVDLEFLPNELQNMAYKYLNIMSKVTPEKGRRPRYI